eukprot:9743094-Ditylum_brightwellii.AAC.1
MNGPNAEGHRDAMDVEISTLSGKESWIIVPHTKDMNMLKSTWAFKCKQFPDGQVTKLKARFCVQGDMYIEGVDVFDIYSPCSLIDH